MRRYVVWFLFLISLSWAQTYDLAIIGGRVLDPANHIDDIRNIGVNNGQIVEVTRKKIKAKEVVNASGFVVVPGFIDILATYPNQDESAIFKVTDGVTSIVSMHGGPVDIRKWYGEIEKQGSYIHYGTTVGHASLRRAVGITDRNAPATPDQLASMLKLGEEALDAGAVGIGFGVQYVPGATREEVLKLFELAASREVPCHLHVRYLGPNPPDNNSIAAIEEVIAGAAVTGASVQVVHIGSMAGRSMTSVLWMIDGARERGIDIMADIYPYTAGSTRLQSTVFDPGWQERMGGISYGDIELVMTGERLDEESFNLFRQAEKTQIIVHFIPEESVQLALAHPFVMVASDGVISDGRGHPRGAGTFSRVLGKYVRELSVISLNEAIRKMTIMPARRLEKSTPSMKRKGRLSAGSDADIVIFDPYTVIDKATYTEPAVKSEGIKYVIVAGKVVVKKGQLNKRIKAGKPLINKE
jgi:N-acyl-D-aspartate/D-glutamate deacylase|tara:strand:+ start:105 stop:1514 length:1410 start_codon:yes stop_codon:yes gene_type:complete